MEIRCLVYADWIMSDNNRPSTPQLVGELFSSMIRNKSLFSFEYESVWLNSAHALSIDADLHLFAGRQFSNDHNFRIFLDSCPDRWGRLLMQRREAVMAKQAGRRTQVLTELDYLLGVHDQYRMGGLRFKRSENGNFVDDNQRLAAPPISSLRELAYAASQVEQGGNADNPNYLKWLFMLISPGSSLGGARPKSSVIDDQQALWIAKFPSQYDDYDIGGWEFVVHQLAVDAGIHMSECRLLRFNSPYHIFLTKRFDRIGTKRLHFSSAMTQLGYYDGDYEASYLELAEFISYHGSQASADLEQLWRRLVFNIAVSNTDDHLRNHGFILDTAGWKLSPAYDINPVIAAQGLHLNITETDNQLDFGLALAVIDYFRLKPKRAEIIITEVKNSVSQWAKKAKSIGIGRGEQERMASAFRVGQA